MADWTGITSYSYDADGRQRSVAYPTGKTLTYGYDPNDNRTTMLDPDGGTTTYAHDPADNLTGIANPFAEITTIAYDALNRESKRIMANGVVTSHMFDPAGNELSRSQINPAGAALLGFTATYDPIGNRLAVEEVDGNRVSYSYDSTSQLLTEQRSGPTAIDTTYVYDPLGNRLTMTAEGAVTTYAYNAANALTLITPPIGAPTTQTYDANGNLVGADTGGALTTYTWDGENRMISSVDPVNGRQDSVYDADGMRTKLITSAGTTNFLRDGLNVLAELDVFLNTVAQYTDNPGYWGGLTSQRRGTQSSFYGFDLSANTRLLTSATGARLVSYLYDAFGVELSAGGFSGAGFVPGMSPGYGGLFRPAAQAHMLMNHLRFGGQFGYWRDLVNRISVGPRILDAAKGRWDSWDPSGVLGSGPNLYRYVGNNPVYYVDPWGFYPVPSAGQYGSVDRYPWPAPGDPGLPPPKYPPNRQPPWIPPPEPVPPPNEPPIPPWGPEYGKYCGPQIIPGKGAGIDQMDECCRIHDKCWGDSNCTFFKGSWTCQSGPCEACNNALAYCASKANCHGDLGCEIVRIIAM